MLATPKLSYAIAQSGAVSTSAPEIGAASSSFLKAGGETLISTSRPLLSNDNRTESAATLSAVLALLSEYSVHLDPKIRAGLLAQTRMIFDPNDWDDEETHPSIDSFRSMVKCIVELSPGIRPNLGVTDDGQMIAMWFNKSSKAVLEFFANDRMRWLVSYPDDGTVGRASGMESIAVVRAIVVAHQVRGLVDGEV